MFSQPCGSQLEISWKGDESRRTADAAHIFVESTRDFIQYTLNICYSRKR